MMALDVAVVLDLRGRSGGHRLLVVEVESNTPGVSNLLEYWSRPNADRITEEFAHGFVLQTEQDGPHRSRMFFFATNKAADAREWVQAIHSILVGPQTLEAFLGEEVNIAARSDAPGRGRQAQRRGLKKYSS
eukprot:s7071_g2.t1